MDAESCLFSAVITADYGETIYTFQMECKTDSSDTMKFTVKDPETISGISGKISEELAALTFDNRVLAFPMLADGQLTPVAAPWVFLKTLKSGYITGCSQEEKGICIYIDDSFEENLIRLLIYTDEASVPKHAEIIYKDRRILTMDINNFTLQ